MSKQTAVEFLIKEFSDILGPIDTTPMQDLLIMDACKQAKKMFKEQTIDFTFNYFLNNQNGEDIEQYYNETFKK